MRTIDLTKQAEYVASVIESKGFHSIRHKPEEALTFRQINHLFAEWGEAFEIAEALRMGTIPPKQREDRTNDMAEELVDIIIVALDLATIHQIPVAGLVVDHLFVLDLEWTNLAQDIGHLADVYRKTYRIDQTTLHSIIERAWSLCQRVWGDPQAMFDQKMIKNAQRPARYNTPHEKYG